MMMPAEWDRHEATWLAWPHETSDWPGKFTTVPWVYAEIIRHLSRVEKVRILVNDGEAQHKASRILQKSGADVNAVEFFTIPTDRSWTRDFCPIFVRNANGAPVLLNWKFNGWAKYSNYQRDDAVTAKLQEALGFEMRTPEWK